MKQITTLIICLLLFQSAFSAPKVPGEGSVPMAPVMGLDSGTKEPASWSMEYRLMLLADLQGQNNSVKVYPNPVSRKDELNINLTGSGKKYLSFYDITGKMVKRVETEKNTIAINVSDLGVGVYILNVKSATLQTTKKVIIR